LSKLNKKSKNKLKKSELPSTHSDLFKESERIILTEFPIDIIVIDEGHRLKNTDAIHRTLLKQIPVKDVKILLSGTPIQNDLSELYSQLDLV
jgi:SNF2 family DNA or RNA helicase